MSIFNFSNSHTSHGGGRTNGNGNSLATGFVAMPLSFFSRVFNIMPSQWPRVTECWLFTFFFKLGSAIGWTVLIASFVSKFGITFLPMLFVLNAILIMFSTLFFEHLIMRIKKEILMIVMILFASIFIFFASFLYYQNTIAFFALIIFAESFFLAQYNIFIPILVGDRFTPLESQKTFPFIESGETIGGILGGAFVGIFASQFPIVWFLYAWIIFLACIIFVFVFTSYLRPSVPPIPVRAYNVTKREKPKDQMKIIFKSIKKMSFLKTLIAIVLLQWVFMNILEFQFTKAVEQKITNREEDTVVYKDDAKFFQTASLAPTPIDGNAGAVAEKISANTPHSIVNRSLSSDQQSELAQKLGTYKAIFFASALIMQILLASRLITWLGIVGSLVIHPLIMLISMIGMFFKFGFTSSFVSRLSFEATYAVHKNAYLTSHYAFPKIVRDQAAEFLEGFIRPLGTIAGMLFIIFLQVFFAGKDLSMFIHIVMFVIMSIVLVFTVRFQKKYTEISRGQLFSSLPYPEKLNAIEILGQRGHKDAPSILVQKYNESSSDDETKRESSVVRIKLLAVLGQYKDYNTLPDILQALYDSDPDIRLEAALALMNFKNIGEKFYSQAFSRHRMIETLKEVFCHEKSSTVRSAIIRLFSLLRQQDIVEFLLDVLKNQSGEVKADCIYTLGLFEDPNTAYYIMPYLNDENLHVRANAIIAMWQFPKYRPRLIDQLDAMLLSDDQKTAKAGIYAIGELRIPRRDKLIKHLRNIDGEISLEAAFALTKCADPIGFHVLLNDLLDFSNDEFNNLRRFLKRLKPVAKKMVENVLVHNISEHLGSLIHLENKTTLLDVDINLLEKLRRLYTLLEQHEELYAIENALEEKIKRGEQMSYIKVAHVQPN